MKRLGLGMLIVVCGWVFGGDVLVRWDRFDDNELRSQAFEIERPQTFFIEAVGPELSGRRAAYAWILDLETRQPVWKLTAASSHRNPDNRRLREFEDEIRLEPGVYQVFFSASYHPWDGNNIRLRFRDVFKWGFHKHFDEDDVRDFSFRLSGEAELFQNTERYFSKVGHQKLLQLNRMEHDSFERVGIRVERKTPIDIYAIGEITRDGNYDAAWIEEADTGRRVWQMDDFETDPAGGAKKNRMFKGKLTLQPGSYVLTAYSDDSHNYGDWNSTPPFDPEAWGITIFVRDDAAIETYDIHAETRAQTVVDLTGLGDNEYVSKAFQLEQETRFRILAVGEGHARHDLADYGWIVDLDRNERVWDMNEMRTEHAGGAEKNRMVDEVITLSPGAYKVVFSTDDSHSYGDHFNASQPMNPKAWGIQLIGLDGFDASSIEDYDELASGNILAKITRMRDFDKETQSFELDRPTKVRIYAIGEGFRDDMADYGWITEVESGRTVWEMTYDKTHHAGGAKKNRLVDRTVRLDAGTYRVSFRTDGSHSFKDWNSRPPRDQENWGITVYLFDE